MRRRIIIAVLLLLAVGGYALVSAGAISSLERKKKDELFRQVELFADSLAIVQADYVDEAKSKDLIYGALKGMLASLDPHSQFMDPDTYNDLKVETEGKFGGLGIEITIKDGLLTIVSPIEDTPAWKAGLKPNDRIVRINNELTRDMTITDAVKKMRGKPGDAVNLTILRESEKKILEFKIIRDFIKIKDIKDVGILVDGIGYIRLVEFGESTPQDFNAALEDLTKQKMSALILDLRNNPGGLLEIAVRVSERFIEKGKMVVYTKGRKPAQNMEFLSRSTNPILDIPIAVLINEGSASASEIVAGCLQDYHRAIIVGAKSFGKGSVQTVIPLGDGSALRLTTSKYFTPLGKVIHGNGVKPDIEVGDLKAEPASDLLSKSEKIQEVFEQVDKKETKPEEKKFDYKADNQLLRAMDALKAALFYREAKK